MDEPKKSHDPVSTGPLYERDVESSAAAFLSGDITADYRRRAVLRPRTAARKEGRDSPATRALIKRLMTPVIKCTAGQKDLRKLRTPILPCGVTPDVPCPPG